MSLLDLSGTWHVASGRQRKAHGHGGPMEVFGFFLRLGSVGLLAAIGWIHLHLWQTGYRHLPTIGPLFLVGAVSAVVFGVGLLGRPSRLLGLAAFGFAVGILASLVISMNVGLFGFKESLSAPFVVEAIAVELAAAVILPCWMVVDLMAESRQDRRGANVA